jgi:hypothetical protein
MPLEKAFHSRTASIFSAMVKRFARKCDKNGRVIRHGRIVPFTIEEFRDWLLAHLGGKPGGSVPCYLCTRPLCSTDFRVEHRVPPRRGGGLGLDNLVPSCDECNRAKGGMTDVEYRNFRIAMDELLRVGKLGVEGYTDVWKRLRGQNIILDAWHRRKKKGSGLLEPEQLGIDDTW